MKELLKNKVFNIIMVTDSIQQMCIWIRNISVLFFVIEKTNADPIAVSLITVLEYAPIFVFSYIGGTLADRWNPKKTMILGDFLSFASVVIILILMTQGLWQAVFVATLVSSVVTQFSVPSSTIIFKRNIDERLITSAVSLSQSMQSLYIIIGPIIGTLLYGGLGITFSLIIIAVMFLASSIVQFALPDSYKKEDIVKTSLVSEMKEGLGYVNKDIGLKVICVVLAILGLAQGLIQPLTIYILRDRLGIEVESLQWFISLSGLGLLVGAILSATFASKFETRKILFSGLIVFALITTGEVLSKKVFITATMYFLSGLVLAFVQVALSSPLIKNVKEEYVGRVSGMITPLLTGGVLIGSGLSGILMKQISLIPIFILSSSILFICAIISLKYKQIDER